VSRSQTTACSQTRQANQHEFNDPIENWRREELLVLFDRESIPFRETAHTGPMESDPHIMSINLAVAKCRQIVLDDRRAGVQSPGISGGTKV